MKARSRTSIRTLLFACWACTLGCREDIPQKVHGASSTVTSRDLLQPRSVEGSNDPTSVAAFAFMKEDYVDAEMLEWRLVSDFDEWKETLERYNQTADALVIRSYQTIKKPGTRENVAPREVMQCTARNATVPTLAFHDFEIEDGVLMGVVKSGKEEARKAAQYALEILN